LIWIAQLVYFEICRIINLENMMIFPPFATILEIFGNYLYCLIYLRYFSFSCPAVRSAMFALIKIKEQFFTMYLYSGPAQFQAKNRYNCLF